MRCYLKDLLFVGEEVYPWKLWREEEWEKIKLGSTVGNRVSQYFLPIPFPFSGKADCLQVSIKLVTPYPRLQGCIVLYYRTGDSIGESSLLWVHPVGPFTSLCSDSDSECDSLYLTF